MSLLETFRIAWSSIMANRLRSALTTLGIVIGVAAVIILVAFGQGASNAVTASIQSLGTNLITVFPDFDPDRPTPAADLTVADVIALNDQRRAPDLLGAAPVTQSQRTCTHAGRSARTSITGTWPSYFAITNSPVASGAYFTNSDEVQARRVAVIGQVFAENLFGSASPLGERFVCDGTPFTVLGVLAEKGSGGFGNPDDVAIIPLSAMENHLTGYGPLTSISVQMASPDVQEAAERQITTILDEMHRVGPDSRDYGLFNQASLLETASQALGIFTALLGTVAAISLLVGGIGITNIMLVSVTERTREIGIRKAIGASRRTILLQFLVESTVLSLVGALIGLAVAVAVAQIKVAGISPTIVPASVIGALAISIGIGLFFGSYPANRAASLRPIEALRHE
ncbi:MAG: ABC transporter permease [Actinomycetales bacterium]|nr:ABC transporter permease [Actinomycetales bacterium]